MGAKTLAVPITTVGSGHMLYGRVFTPIFPEVAPLRSSIPHPNANLTLQPRSPNPWLRFQICYCHRCYFCSPTIQRRCRSDMSRISFREAAVSSSSPMTLCHSHFPISLQQTHFFIFAITIMACPIPHQYSLPRSLAAVLRLLPPFPLRPVVTPQG